MAIPPIINLEIYQGDSYSLPFRARSRTASGGPGAYYDLTGSTPRAQIRDKGDDAVIMEFTCTLADQTTSSGKGRINVELTAVQTAALPVDVEKVWDVQVTWPDGRVQTFLRGDVTTTKEVTR